MRASARRAAGCVLAVGLLAALAACSAEGSSADGAARVDAAASAAAVARQAPADEEAPAATVAPGAAAGSVEVLPGPFVERLRLSALALSEPDAGGAQTVTGQLDVVSDVSEVIALEVRVDCYDAAGALLGSGRQVLDSAATEQFHSAAGVIGVPLSVSCPAGAAHSAILSVPVLVNE
ncbi:hypothetical protein [Pengzhenrongella sicca]|uniref:Lipoprotein n=1 Tax=Pengzhenrongella sicca TaxID=2819238 RepID=A0A8A4ZEZ4_9MICO|nr:hypothetical protein [Pengzhenrongella sicca]QTE28268.1 hypothetical protein J4E96_12840 [Pengzhenrongella sicca]